VKVVIDTNVVVSGLRGFGGPCVEILDQVAAGKLEAVYSTGILLEYQRILERPKFHFSPQVIDAFLDMIERDGLLVSPVLLPPLRDASDTKFLEAAVTAGAAYLVTGNLKDFPAGSFQGVKILSPAGFLKAIHG
jgi:putative PIN family toxin of toxin-antitoxin system